MSGPADIDSVAIERALAPALASPGDTLVALDFDGTVAPIVARPSDARALPGTADVLTAVARRVARVAIITGRPAADAVAFGELAAVPRLIVLGHYGLERYDAGRVTTPGRHAGVEPARESVRALAATRPGVEIEDKSHSVAVHTRRADDPAATFAELEPYVAEVATETGLQVTPGRFVLELRPPGVDKGVALSGVIDEVGASVVVFAGDDVGDIPAVMALRARTEIAGVVVCSDAEEASTDLRDRADLVVPGPAGVLTALRVLT